MLWREPSQSYFKARLTQNLCKDIEKGHDPTRQALFGPTAGLLEEHVTASEHLEQKRLVWQ